MTTRENQVFVIMPGNGGDKPSFVPFKTLSKLFCIYGLDIDPFHNSSKKTIIIRIGRVFALLSFITVAYFVVSMLLESFNGIRSLVTVTKGALDLSAFILWGIIQIYRKEIALVIKGLNKLISVYKPQQSRMLMPVCIAWMLIVQVALTAINIATHPIHSKRKHYLVTALDFLSPSISQALGKWASLFLMVLTAFNVTITHTLVCSFIALYVVICKQMEGVLYCYGRENLRLSAERTSNEDFSKRMRSYSTIRAMLHTIEASVAFPVFFAFSCNVLGVFSTFAFFLMSSRIHIWMFIVAPAFVCFVNISTISLTASRVNVADAFAKHSNREMQHASPLCHGVEELDAKFRYMDANNETPFALSAWGFFQFTRGFFFAAIGCIITYSLLVINVLNANNFSKDPRE